MILNVRERLGALSVVRVRKKLAALATALLLGAVSFSVAVPGAGAHSATKQVTGQKQVCTTEWVQVRVATNRSTAGRGNRITYTYKNELREVCSWVPTVYTVNRAHLHVTDTTCRWIEAAGIVAGTAIVGTGSGGTAAAAGAAAGGLAGHYVCKSLPSIVWLA